MFSFKYLPVFLLLTCCGEQTKKNITGRYVSKKADLVDRLRNPTVIWSMTGCRLKLDADSTFQFENCGTAAKGDWHLERDSLILDIEHAQLLYNGKELKKTRRAYFVGDEGELRRLYYTRSKDRWTRDFFVRVAQE